MLTTSHRKNISLCELFTQARVSAVIKLRVPQNAMNVGPCHHGMARPRVADGGTASNMEGSCE